jgi:hypothetical protein
MSSIVGGFGAGFLRRSEEEEWGVSEMVGCEVVECEVVDVHHLIYN